MTTAAVLGILAAVAVAGVVVGRAIRFGGRRPPLPPPSPQEFLARRVRGL